MAFRYSPKIVTTGLLLYIDGANTKSYTTGATWSDLSRSLPITLVNSPVFNSSFGGYLSFDDASSQYATCSDLGSLSQWTVEVWFRLTTSLSSKVSSIVTNVFNGSNLNFSIGTNNAPTNYNLCVGFFNGAWRNTTGFTASVNQWYQVVGTYDGTNLIQYVNGSASGGSLTYSGTSASGGGLRFMRRWDDVVSASNLVDGDLQVVKIYNIALSSTQITQNWNAQKSRFGF